MGQIGLWEFYACVTAWNEAHKSPEERDKPPEMTPEDFDNMMGL